MKLPKILLSVIGLTSLASVVFASKLRETRIERIFYKEDSQMRCTVTTIKMSQTTTEITVVQVRLSTAKTSGRCGLLRLIQAV